MDKVLSKEFLACYTSSAPTNPCMIVPLCLIEVHRQQVFSDVPLWVRLLVSTYIGIEAEHWYQQKSTKCWGAALNALNAKMMRASLLSLISADDLRAYVLDRLGLPAHFSEDMLFGKEQLPHDLSLRTEVAYAIARLRWIGEHDGFSHSNERKNELLAAEVGGSTRRAHGYPDSEAAQNWLDTSAEYAIDRPDYLLEGQFGGFGQTFLAGQ